MSSPGASSTPSLRPRSWVERLWSSMADRGRPYAEVLQPEPLASPLDRARELAAALLSERGEASGAAVARELHAVVRDLGSDDRLAFPFPGGEFPSGRGAVASSGGGLSRRTHARARDAAGRSRRAGAPGTAPPHEHGARRHGGAGRHAQGDAGPPARDARARAARRRLAPPVRVLVQPRVPGAAADRLADPGRGARKADRLRGGA